MSPRLHILGRKEACAAVGRVFGDPTRRLISPVAVVSISGDEPPLRELVRLGVPLLGLQFDDVPRDAHGYNAPKREQIERLIAWWDVHAPDGDVIVHCAAGISRSSACALTLIAAGYGKDCRTRESARLCVLDLLAMVHATEQAGLRDDLGIRPNPRIVWLADQILGWDGHLLAAVEDVFAMRGLWVDLGEEPPVGWPGRAA